MNAPAPLDWTDANQRVLVAEFAALRARLGDDSPQTAALAEARAALRAQAPEPPAIDRLAALFGLSDFEREVLLLLAGVEMDAALAQRVPRPSFGLALAALEGAHWSALAPLAPLRAWRLVELEEGGPAQARLRIDERILHHLAGVNHLDARLLPLLRRLEPALAVAPSHADAAASLARALDTRAGSAPALLMLHGADAEGRRGVAAAVADRCGLAAFTLAAADLPAAAAEQEALAVLWQREAALLPAALLIECDDTTPAAEAALQRFVRRVQGPGRLVMVSARDALPADALAQARIDRPGPADQLALWQAALEAGAPPALRASCTVPLRAVSAQFRLGAEAIVREAAALVREHAAGEPAEALAAGLWRRCGALARTRLDDLAERIEPRAGWDDLVLPPPQAAVLRQLAAQVRERARVHDDWGFAAHAAGPRGLGVSALFCGESGVGKTLACEVLARELALDLYRVDLSGVVSKYIGETEKNLRRVFDAAEDGGVLLLFDEADALFGRRSEVKDSHDRYANLEVSYLLQRMEAYRGLAVLTSNQRQALDPAFLRRLRFVVQFPFPDAVQREALWRRAFPADTPRQALDAEALARLQLTGGHIRNIALNAAFLAAEQGAPVAMAHLATAARQEAAKHERTLPEAQLRAWNPAGGAP